MVFPWRDVHGLKGSAYFNAGGEVASSSDGSTKVRMLLETTPRQSWSIKQSTNALRESMDETMGRICRRLDRSVGLALSGGLDSRIFLASLHTQGIEHRSFTYCYTSKERENEVARDAANLLCEQQSAVVLDKVLPGILANDCRLINEGESKQFGFCYLL